jgi:methionyl-tRNA formyltransferase
MKIIVFGDDLGLPVLFKYIPIDNIVGVVGASIRPQYHDFISNISCKYNLPYFIQPKPKHESYGFFIEWVKSLSPDLFLVNSYSMILREDLLSIPRLGGINIHGSLLPEYKGSNPIQWSILNLEDKSGVTMHEMTLGLDDGPIIAREEVPMYFEDTWVNVSQRVWAATEKVISDNISSILSGTWDSVQQDDTKAKLWSRRKPSDGLFDWSQSIVEIYNLTRALVAPLPGSRYIENDNEIIIDYYLPLERVIKLKHKVCGPFSLGSNLKCEIENYKASEYIFSIFDEKETYGVIKLKNLNWSKKTGEAIVLLNTEECIDLKECIPVLKKLFDFEFGLTFEFN